MEEKIKNLKNENVKKVEEVELQPSWSKLKSFHEKAYVGTKENGDKYLKSFGFLVCEIIKGKVKIHNEVDKWGSKSTIRHINNFLYENGLNTGNVKELTELYITKTKKIEKVENAKETKTDEKTQNEKLVTIEKLKIEKTEDTKPVDKKENKLKENVKVEKTKNQKTKNSKIENVENDVKVGA